VCMHICMYVCVCARAFACTHTYIYAYTRPALAHRGSRHRGTGSVGDSVGEGTRAAPYAYAMLHHRKHLSTRPLAVCCLLPLAVCCLLPLAVCYLRLSAPSPVCPLYVPYMSLMCPLFVPYMPLICPLYVPNMSTICHSAQDALAYTIAY